MAPESAAGPYSLMQCGMPEDWLERYRREELHKADPIPGMAFRLGHPERVEELLKSAPSFNADESAFIEAFQSSGLTDALVVPTYGPYGRPGLIAVAQMSRPDLIETIDIPLLSAVAQAVHTRMELLRLEEQLPPLSPREREILGWLAKGKSAADIASILGLKTPTVITHTQRIYAKLRVHDRVNCVMKAMSRHYI